MKLPRVLRSFLIQSACWTALCLICELIALLLHWGYPYNYPAVPYSAVFGDFRFFVSKFNYFHSPRFFSEGPPLMYPAPILVAYKFFLLFPNLYAISFKWSSTLRFELAILVTYAVMFRKMRQALLRRGLEKASATRFLLASALLSFPFWFELHQGNIELVVWIVVSLSIWAVWTGRFWWAATFIGIATSMKIFPFVFLGLLLTQKKYKQIFYSVLVMGATTIVSLWLVCPDIRYAQAKINAGVADFREIYMLHLRPLESRFDHSLFGLFKRLFPTLPPPATVAHLLSGYFVVVGLCGILLFFLRIRKMPLVNQILSLSTVAILLPPTSFDYTLLHLYAPFALLVFVAMRAAGRGDSSPPPGLMLMFSLLAFLLSAQQEFIWHGVGFAGQLKAVALLAFWITAMVFPFEHRESQLVAA